MVRAFQGAWQYFSDFFDNVAMMTGVVGSRDGQVIVQRFKVHHSNGPSGLVQTLHPVLVNKWDEDLGQHLSHDLFLPPKTKSIFIVDHDGPVKSRKHVGALLVQRNLAESSKQDGVHVPRFLQIC